ncbi:FUSC family protein [Quadrisphaera sp. KR29]|uniref:FUSC family protein n=1 Tax=Quadrisphaera sp. KR29 TaxID=3461391 RepID=UPI0040446C3B
MSRPRLELRSRVARLRGYAWHVVLCASGAGLAYLVARYALGHEQPIFAPIAAVLGLGVSYGQRLRRVGEVVVGVAIGVLIGDLLVRAFGTGAWQIALVVGLGMSVAILLRAGTLMINQIAIQGVFITLYHPATTGAIVDRWTDAATGGAVALLLATLVPRQQLRRPVVLAQEVLATVADLLLEASSAARDGDVDSGRDALAHARGTQERLDRLRAAVAEGLDVARLTPFRRHHAVRAQTVQALVVPLDRAVRNIRVLSRRLAVATERMEVVPAELLVLVDELAGAVLRLSEDLGAGRALDDAVDALAAVGLASVVVPRSSLSADVVLAQVRSATVDLLMVAGLDDDAAHEKVPVRAGERFG